MKTFFLVLTIVILFVTGLSPAVAQIPRTLSYQGVLTDNAGNPRPDGSYSFTFRFYTSPTGGTAIWSESNSLPVKNGLFSTVLGEQTPFGAAVKFDQQYWLGIQVGNEPELSPRITLTSVGYSLSSLRADTASVSVASLADTTWKHSGANIYRLNGNVGIGTTSPNTKFHFVGDQAYIVGTATNGWAALDVDNTGNGPIALFRGNGNVGIGTTSPSTKFHFVGDQAFFVGTASNGSAAMDVDNTGNGPIALFRGNGGVGIGTTSPSTKFHFVGDQAFFVGTASNGSAAMDVDNTGNGPIALFRGNGNVGIGTTDPTSKLHVEGTTTTKVLAITGGMDLAEPFEISKNQPIPKGALVIIDEENPGQLKLSHQAYDKRVAGVVSGAGGINPGLTLTQEGVLEGGQNVALTGRVYALATAANGPIKPGDLLTTSEVPGHAMKAMDHERAYGAVIGKAMSTLESGEGLVLVLIQPH